MQYSLDQDGENAGSRNAMKPSSPLSVDFASNWEFDPPKGRPTTENLASKLF